MNRGIPAAALVAVLCLAPNAYTQQTTERFIPVGMSPGITGEYSYSGQIQSVDEDAMTVTVEGSEGARTIKVTEQTRIWLDRSERRMTNEVGSMADLQPGRRVEIKYVDYETKDTADWIKVVPG